MPPGTRTSGLSRPCRPRTGGPAALVAGQASNAVGVRGIAMRAATRDGTGSMSGSGGIQKRKLTARIAVNCTPKQKAIIVAKCDAAGFSPSAFVSTNFSSLGLPLPERRHPDVDTQLLAKVLAELGKIGSNINQIAHRYNITEGRPSGNIEGALETALNELLEWRMAVMQALGYERNRKEPKQ